MTITKHPRIPAIIVSCAHLITLTVTLTTPAAAQRVPFEGSERPQAWVEIRLGRFQQSNQWSRLDELSRNALEVAIENDLTDLKIQAQWYQTLVLAQKGGKPRDVLAALKKAVEYGYRSVQGIESADELAVIKANPEIRPQFHQLLQDLRRDLAADAVARFHDAVETQLKANRGLRPPSVGIHALSRGDGESVGHAGRPIVVVLSRTYHAGFRKQWPLLADAVAPFADRVTALALFYENDAENALVQEEVGRFAAACGVAADGYAIVDRARFKAIRDRFRTLHEERQRGGPAFNFYYPFLFIVDGDGVPLYGDSGVFSEAELQFSLERALALPAAGQHGKETAPQRESGESGESRESEPPAKSEPKKDAPPPAIDKDENEEPPEEDEAEEEPDL